MSAIKLSGNSIFCITDKETGQFCCFGPKIAWTKEQYAKAAYNMHYAKDQYWQREDFIDLEDSECPYEIIEIKN